MSNLSLGSCPASRSPLMAGAPSERDKEAEANDALRKVVLVTFLKNFQQLKSQTCRLVIPMKGLYR